MLSLAGVGQEPVEHHPAGSGSIVLDVPYLPQTEALCGGAAVAMVFRYWGEAHAGVQPFAALVDRRAGGIATSALVAAVEQRKWQAVQLAGSIEALQRELRARHPVVLLIEDRPKRYHYVVAIGADAGHILLHDPAWGPSRRIPTPDLQRRWRAAHFWSLVILPGDARAEDRVAEAPAPSRGADAGPKPGSPCDRLIDAAIDEVRERGFAHADAIFGAMRVRCPDSARPSSELAGVRFAERRWKEAAALAEQALARDDHDAYAWDVLGSSRFMQNDEVGALRAWNRIGKPRVDAVRIEGLVRTRYASVADALALPTGSLLTEQAFRRAARRLDELPDQSSARIGYRPETDGFADVDVGVAERPSRPRGATAWAADAARTAVNRELVVGIPGSTGQGELWTASWRWWDNRPRVAMSFATPHRGALAGVWRVEGSWDAQTYAFTTNTVREERAHGSLTISDWTTADLRYAISGGFDSWNGVRRAASVGGSLERRFAGDRLSIEGGATAWIPLSGDRAFQTSRLRASFRSSLETTGLVVVASAGVERASASSPLSLWPGAGEGHARAQLLRAHPLLQRGVISGSVFGPRLLFANLETQRWMNISLPMRFALAGFVDAAGASRRAGLATGDAFQIDAGAGLRMKVPGQRSVVRIDLARGLLDGRHAITVGWQY